MIPLWVPGLFALALLLTIALVIPEAFPMTKLKKLLGLHVEPALVLGALGSIAQALSVEFGANGIHSVGDVVRIALPFIVGIFIRTQVSPVGS